MTMILSLQGLEKQIVFSSTAVLTTYTIVGFVAGPWRTKRSNTNVTDLYISADSDTLVSIVVGVNSRDNTVWFTRYRIYWNS